MSAVRIIKIVTSSDDDALLDRDYDFFHDERAIALTGGGKVYY